MNKLASWLRAMRLHTLPVSVAGVLASAGCAAYLNVFNTAPFIICLLFAIGAQIVSNFANEYFDYRNGLDKKGRIGFRRGVTEGDISPKAMRNATFGLLLCVCALGASLIYWGGWWLIAVGVLVALFAIGYSAGPFPLSHHALGELAVIIFFGFVPVIFTTYVQSASWIALPISIPIGGAVGFMAANVLIVNNYRDINDDRAAGKNTLAVRFGPRAMTSLYFANGIIALLCMEWVILPAIPLIWQIGAFVYINLHYILWCKLKAAEGAQLNPVLGQTAMLMLLTSIWLLILLAVNHLPHLPM